MADVTEELLLPPCKVCGGKSSGRHFGVIACEACKSFFKRNKKRQKPYRCRGEIEGACTVKAGLGYPVCPYCRHQACIMAGMSRDGIHKGRCPNQLKKELYQQAKQYEVEARNAEGSKQKDNGTLNGDKVYGKKEAILSVTLEHVEQQPEKNVLYSNVQDPTDTHGNGAENAQDQHIIHGYHGLPYEVVEAPFSEPELVPSFQGEFLSLLTDATLPTSEILDNFSQDETLYPEASSYSTCKSQVSLPQDSDVTKIAHPEILVQTLIDVDAAYSLYDPEELVDVQNIMEYYVKTRVTKEQLLGELRPLPHDVYTEVYKSTGIDIDDYRKKIFTCIHDLRPDIDIFLDYIRKLPGYKDLSLKDRTLLVKGGFPGWTVLSSIGSYNCDLDLWACTSEVIYNTNDFINYYGNLYSQSIRSCLTILQHAHVTTAELAILKAMHIFKARPQVGQIEDSAALGDLQKILHEALQYVLERDRGPEQAKFVMDDILEIFPYLDGITVSFLDNVKNWPIKFPEYSYPRILLEMVGTEAEEELLVAVSVQLNIND